MPRLQASLENERGYANSGLAIFGGSSSTWDPAEPSPELRWPYNIAVYDRMRRTDAQVGSTMRALLLCMLGKTFRLDPNGADPKVVEHCSQDVSLPVVGQEFQPPARTRGRFSFRKHLRAAALAFPYGHMPFEQVYRIEGSGDAQRAHLHKLAPRMPGTLADILVAKDGGLDGIVQYGDGLRGVEIGVDRLVMYTNELEGAAWAGQSILRTCYKDWLHKDRLVRVDTITGERAGMGIVEIEMPPNVSDPADVAKYLQMGQELRAGERAAIAMPNGGHARLRGVEGTLPDLIEKIRYHDEQIARNAMQMVFMLGTTASGSRALGETLLDVFDMSVDSATEELVDIFNEHVLEDLVDLNFGEGERAPRIVHSPAESSRDLDPQSLRYLVEVGVIEPDDALEAQQRSRFRLPEKDQATKRPAIHTRPAPAQVAARARSRRAAAATDDPESDPTALPEPLGTIYQRRHDLEASMNATLAGALLDLADGLDLSRVVDAAGIVRADSSQPVEPDPKVTAAEAAAAEVLTEAAATAGLRDVGHDALVNAWAEGRAGAAQLVSVTAGQVGVDLDTFTVTFTDAISAAADLDSLWAQADTWVADWTGVVSRAMGDAVATALADGVSRAELLADLRAVVEDAQDAAVLYDHAMATALDQGALDLYASEGLEQVEVLTAGDSRVDDICLAFDEHGPYALADSPELPAHIGCRCATSPADDAIRKLLHG